MFHVHVRSLNAFQESQSAMTSPSRWREHLPYSSPFSTKYEDDRLHGKGARHVIPGSSPAGNMHLLIRVRFSRPDAKSPWLHMRP